MVEARMVPHPNPLLTEERKSGARVRREFAGSGPKSEARSERLDVRS
jgi:hypothetical protein